MTNLEFIHEHRAVYMKGTAEAQNKVIEEIKKAENDKCVAVLSCSEWLATEDAKTEDREERLWLFMKDWLLKLENMEETVNKVFEAVDDDGEDYDVDNTLFKITKQHKEKRFYFVLKEFNSFPYIFPETEDEQETEMPYVVLDNLTPGRNATALEKMKNVYVVLLGMDAIKLPKMSQNSTFDYKESVVYEN
ncbi:MAG: hypothetical protein IJ353_07275 [Lachnospiraceae bacterium]|nr:hypothetical protein [Lachnospiraceae bacterium]